MLGFFFQLSSRCQRPLHTRCLFQTAAWAWVFSHNIMPWKKNPHQSNHNIQSQMVVQNNVSNFPASDRPQDVASGQSPPGSCYSVLLDEVQASARDSWTLPSNILKYTIVQFQLLHQEVKSASLFLLCRRGSIQNLLFLFLESMMTRWSLQITVSRHFVICIPVFLSQICIES